MRKDVIRLSRRRRQRIHIIEHDIAGRTVRDASCSASREDALAPMTVLTRSRPGGHHERHPLARNLNGPPLTRKATLETYTVASDSHPPPLSDFRHPRAQTPRGVASTPPGVLQAPQGCCKPPRGVASTPRVVTEAPPGTNHPPGARETLPGGWLTVRTRGPRYPRRGRCSARPPTRPDAASPADTTTALSHP